MPQILELKVKLQDAEAKQKAFELQKQLQSIQQSAQKQMSFSLNTNGATQAVNTLNAGLGKTLSIVERINSKGKSATTVTLKTNFSEIEKETQRLAQSTEKARSSLERSLSGEAFSNYKKGIISLDEAIAQTSRTVQYSSSTWQSYYNSLSGISQQCGVTAKEVSVFGQLSDEAFDKYSSGAMSADAANKSLETSTRKAGKETQEIGEKAQKTSKAFVVMTSVLIRLAHTALSAVTRSFREALTEMKNVDSELVVVRKVSNATAEELSALKDRAYEVGAAYGVAASDYLNAAAEMTRAGYREQAGDLAELATKLQLVGDVSQETANQFLIATDKAYKMNGDFVKLSSTIDKLNEIDNNYATSIQKVADGIGILAPIASQTHVSFEQMAAALGTITAVTQRSGAESARALRSLFLNIAKDTNTEIEDGVTVTVEQINNLQDALKKYAPEVVKAAEATGQLINPMEAIGALSKAFKEGVLDEQELMRIVSGLGGKLRSSQLLALIQNWDMYNEMLRTTADAAGSADREVSNALDSWDKKLQQLKNTFTQFTESILNTEEIKDFLDAGKFLILSVENPEEYADKVSAMLESAINSLVQKLPKIQVAIGRLATTLVKALASSLAKEAPSIAKALAEGSRLATKELMKELPSMLKDLFRAIGGLVGQSIADSGLAIDITNAIIDGVIQAIPNALLGGLQGLSTTLVDSISNDKGFDDFIVSLLGSLAKRLGGITGRWIIGQVEKSVNEKANKGSEAKIKDVGNAVSEVKDAIDSESDALKEAESASEGFSESQGNAADEVSGLKKEVETATKALDKYKEALAGGEKGDGLKSAAEAYKKAVELAGKGLTGTNAFMSAIDLLFSPEQMRKLGWDYEEAAKQLSKPFFKAMFEGDGEDFGSNAANYIRQHQDEFEGVLTKDLGDGKFSLMITDMDEFSKSANVSKDVLYLLVDALDAWNSSAAYTSDELDNLIEKYAQTSGAISIVDNNVRSLNLEKFVKSLIDDGKTEREIYQIVDGLRAMAETDPTFTIEEPESLDDIVQSLYEVKENKENVLEIDVESNADKFFDGVEKNIKRLDGSAIRVNLTYGGWGSKGATTGGIVGGVGLGGGSNNVGNVELLSKAEGDTNSRGGLALVNDGGGAEIIAANGKAWIAGGGKPAITNIPSGATVFNAEETRGILARSGIPSFEKGVGNKNRDGWATLDGTGQYYAGYSTVLTDIGINTGNGSGSKANKATKNLQAILDELSKYIDKILKKAKDALDAQLKAIDAQIEALEREHNAEEDKNKLEELRLKVLEAEKRLVEAQNERTVRYFNKETGQWEWMADQKAVYKAEQALKEAQEAYDKEVAEQAYQAQIQALKDLKEALQGEYDNLADYWEQIVNALTESSDGNVDVEKLLKSLGIDSGSTANIRELIKSIQEYEKKLASGSYDMPLDSATTNRIMGAFGVQGTGTNSIGQVFGISTADSSAKGSSIYSSSASSVVGDTIYYINGLKIGADMMDKPLSEILSRLSIYAN